MTRPIERRYLRVLVWGVVAAPTAVLAQGGGSNPPPNPEIAFADGGIRVMNADGSNVRLVVSAKGADVARAPCWSPDGAQLAFYGLFGGAKGVWAVNVNGTGRRLVTPVVAPTGVFTFTDWSRVPAPDGVTKIAFTHQPPGGTKLDVYIVNPDGTGLLNVTDSPTLFENYAGWSRDGARLYVCRNPETLVAIDLGLVGGLVAPVGETVLMTGQDFSWPRSANMSETITYGDLAGGSAYKRIVALDLSVFPLSPRVVTPVTSGDERVPSFSPDDTRLVFRREGSAGGIFTINADGSNERKINGKGLEPYWKRPGPESAPPTTGCAADCNSDNRLTVADLVCFQRTFGMGCP